MDFDSIVVGAGVIGLAVGRELARSGRQVLVLGDGPEDYHDFDPALELVYQPTANVLEANAVLTWERHHHFRPSGWSLQDYDYRKPSDFNMTRGSAATSQDLSRSEAPSASGISPMSGLDGTGLSP